jgi:hypothetical protein
MPEQPSHGNNPELEELIAACTSPDQIKQCVRDYWEKLGAHVDPTGRGIVFPKAVPQLSRIITLDSGRRMIVEATSEEDLNKGERIAREKYS